MAPKYKPVIFCSIRCVVQLFLMAGGSNASPTVMEHITLPCLRILQGVMRPPTPPPPRKSRDKTPMNAAAFVTAVVAAASASSAASTDLMAAYLGGSKVRIETKIKFWLFRKHEVADDNNSFSVLHIL